MRKPSNNWVTCDAKCHGYPATDYSWHPTRWNIVPRKQVYAIIDSTVTKVDANAGDCGVMIELSGTHNGKTVRYRYCHMNPNQVYVEPNQKVKEGFVVGKMGNSGKSTGTHLHFYLYESGKRVPDPDAWVIEQINKENDVYKGKTAKQWHDLYQQWRKKAIWRGTVVNNFRDGLEKIKAIATDKLNKPGGGK